MEPWNVARFETRDIQRLIGDPGIVRARTNIEAASRGPQVHEPVSLRRYCQLWRAFHLGHLDRGKVTEAQTALSATTSKDQRPEASGLSDRQLPLPMQAVNINCDQVPTCFRKAGI